MRTRGIHCLRRGARVSVLQLRSGLIAEWCAPSLSCARCRQSAPFGYHLTLLLSAHALLAAQDVSHSLQVAGTRQTGEDVRSQNGAWRPVS